MAGSLSGAGVRVIAIGSGRYEPGSMLPDVPSVGPTVYDLTETLVSRCGLDPAQLQLIMDSPGPENLLDAILVAADQASELLMVIYVGHGVLDVAGELHLATRVTRDITKGKAAYQALPFSELNKALLVNRQNRSLAVILDCCYSGRAALSSPSSSLLVSADRDERALAIPGEKYTAFTGQLIKLLQDGDPLGPPQISLNYAYHYMARKLAELGRPEPHLNSGDKTAELILAANPVYSPPVFPADQAPADADPAVSQICPYPGLAPFTADDTRFFFGRDSLTESLVRALSERLWVGGLLGVVGSSGSGKSSLLQAGLLPALRRGDLGASSSADWHQLFLTPGDDPLAALSAALATLREDVDPVAVAGMLRDNPRAIGSLLGNLHGPALGRSSLVIVVDQLEEVFTQCADESSRRAFVEALAAATTPAAPGTVPPAVVVFGLRADFYGPCAAYPELADALQHAQIVVGAMNADELRDAIEQPARLSGLAFQEGFVDVLLRDIGASEDPGTSAYDPGALPLLSFALQRTWRQRDGRFLTLQGYHATGGIRDAIAVAAAEAYSKLTDSDQSAARNLLLRLVVVGPDSVTTRRRVNATDLTASQPDPEAARRALDALAEARLITLDNGWAQITHESVITAWPDLRTWIDADRAGILVHQQLEDSAAVWSSSRDAALLYRGSLLGTALAWTNDGLHRSRLSTRAAEFLDLAARQARRTRIIRRAVTAGLVVLVLIASTAAIIAFQQRSAASADLNLAQVNQVTAVANQESITDPSAAAELDLAAYQARPTTQGYTGLVAAENSILGRPVSFTGTAEVTAVAVSDASHLLAVGTSKGKIVLASLAALDSPKPVNNLTAVKSPQIKSLAFNPSGTLLAVVDDSGDVTLLDVSNPSSSFELNGFSESNGDELTLAAVSFVGTRTLAVATADGTVQLLEPEFASASSVTGFKVLGTMTSPGTPRGVTINVGNTTDSFAVSANGKILVNAYGKTVSIWNVADPAHPSYITRVPVTSGAGSVAISPDGRALSVGNLDGTATLWNIAKPSRPSLDSQLIPAVRGAAGESTGVLSVNSGAGTTASGSIDQVAFSPNGRVVANGSGDGTISVWDVASPTSPVQLGQPATARGNLFSLAFSQDNTTLLSGGNGGYIWTVPHSQLGVVSDVRDVTVAADAPVMATSNGANLIQLWNVSDPLEPQLIGHIAASASPNVLALSPDGRELAMGSANDTVQVWNVSQPGRPESVTQETIPNSGEETPIYSLSLDQTGNSAVVGDENGTIALVNVPQKSLSFLRDMTTEESSPDPQYVAISSDGRSVVSCDNDQGQVILWNTATRGRESSLTMPQSIGGCASAAFDTSGKEVSVGSGEGWAWLLKMSQGKHLAQFAAPFVVSGTNGGISTAFSPGDASLVTSSSGDGLVKLWDIADPGHPVLDGPLNSTSGIGVNSLAVGDRGRLVAIGSNDSVGKVWDLNTTSETSIICESTGGGLSRAQWTGYVAQDSYKAECP